MSSAAIIVGLPYLPPRPPLQPGWEKTQIIWEGSDGSTWNLSDPETGVFLVRSGVRGLGDTKIEQKRDKRVGVPGSYYRTTDYGAREVHWTVYIYHDGSTREYVERVDAFWNSLDPEVEGTMRVRIPGVRERTIRLRYDGEGNPDYDLDPAFFGWMKYGIDLQADQPFFADGTGYLNVWEAEEVVDFFGIGDDVVVIGSGQSIDNAEVVNQGDRPATPLITFFGPFLSAEVEIGGRIIEVPFSMEDGELLNVNSDPSAYSVIDGNGANRFSEMGQIDWPVIPAGGTVPVSITIEGGDGAGRVGIEFSHMYRRAL